MIRFLKKNIKKNNFLYFFLKTKVIFFRKCIDFIIRNSGLLNIKEPRKNNLNIFVFDTRVNSILFDSLAYLIRASNFFYKDKWNIIIYEDDSRRYADKHVSKEIYLNYLINIFLQTLLILPNPPTSIKFVKNSYELLNIIRKSKKIFPEDYNYLNDSSAYLVKDFNEKDFQNFKVNQPILKATKFHSEIFENYLKYRDIKKYITITIRGKNWNDAHWNTDLDDMKLYFDFIKKNDLKDYDILILPDTQQDVPKEIIDFIKKNKLKFYIFSQGSFSIPMRFLAYSRSSFNFGSSNGPTMIFFFISNNTFQIQKDPFQSDDNRLFVDKFNKNIFLDRRFIFYEKHTYKKEK